MSKEMETILEDVTNKLGTAAALFLMEYNEAQAEGRHLDYGLDAKLRPIVARLLPLLEAGERMYENCPIDALGTAWVCAKRKALEGM